MPGESALFEEVFELFARTGPAERSLEEVLRKALDLVGSRLGAIFLLDEDRAVLVRRAHVGMPPEVIGEYRDVPLGSYIIGTVGSTGEKILVEDAERDDRVRLPFLSGVGIRSFGCVPILSRGKVFGVLTAGSPEPGAIDRKKLSTMATVGHQIGVAIDNARLLIRSRRSERLYRHLVDHGPGLNLLCDTEFRIHRMNRNGHRFFGTDPGDSVPPVLVDLLEPPAMSRFRAARDALIAGATEGTEFEIALVDSDGRQALHEFQSSLVREEEARFYIHFVGRDLTRRKELESRLLEYADQLEGEVNKRVRELRAAKNQIAYLFRLSRRLGDLERVEEKLDLVARAVSDAGLFRRALIRVHNREGKGGKVAAWGYGGKSEVERVIGEVFAPNVFESAFLSRAYHAGSSYLLPAGKRREEKREGGSEWRAGDRLIVPLSGEAGHPIGFLVAEDPPEGMSPGEDLVQVMELFVGMAAQVLEGEKLSRKLREADRLRREKSRPFNVENLIGSTPAMREVFDAIRKLANVRSSVLITGESGTGKELVANAIHVNGNRGDGPFVKINCAAIPETLLESELFGIEKNVASNVDRRTGKFELADGGTIFLDEIGDMSLVTQAKVLRVLQERVVERVGGSAPIPVDVRILAATNRDPLEEVEAGNLRQDLFFRLHVVRIHLPPLRERRADIPALAEYLVDRICREQDRKPKRLSADVLDLFQRYPWVGNVRQLRNCLERTLIMGGDREEIVLDDLPPGIRRWDGGGWDEDEIPGQTDLPASLESYERRLIQDALEKASGVQSRAAKLLGISERAMWYRVKKLKISTPGHQREVRRRKPT